MAGESPDKSDKKQSSGKTARSERDPRLTVFREEPDDPAKGEPVTDESVTDEPVADESAKSTPAKKPAKKAAAKKSPAKKATAKKAAAKKAATPSEAKKATAGDAAKETAAATEADTPDAPEAAETPEAAEAGNAAGAAAKAPDGPEKGAEEAAEPSQEVADGGEGSGGGDDRLRAAVAAWVAKSGEPGESGESGEGNPAEDADADTAEADADADDADAAAGDVDGADADAGAEGDAGAKAGVAKAAEKSEADAAAESDSAVDSESERERDSASESKSASSSESASESDSGAAEAAVVDQPTAVFTIGQQRSGAKADAKVVGAADGKAGEAGEAEARDAGDGDGEESAEADEQHADSATRVFAFAKSKGAGGGESVDQPTTTFKITPPAKTDPKPDAKPEAETGGGAEGKPDAKAENKAESKVDNKTDGKSDGKTTAKPMARSVEKPTAARATKDGKGAKGATDGKDGSGSDSASDSDSGAPKSERPAERTSQFVALKSTDVDAAERSIGKTAAATPARTPDKPAEAPDKSAGKAAAKGPGAMPPAAPAKPGTPPTAGSKAATGASAATGAGAPARPQPEARPEPRPEGGPQAQPGALPESERTRQEPLPPLDLLAKLTNTPPPPETPLRTVVRRFKIWTPLVVLLAIIFVIVQSVRTLPAPVPTVGSSTAFTFGGGKLAMPWPDQGQSAAEVVGVGSLGTSGAAKPVPTASVAKVMTAYVILRDHPLKKDEKGATITIDAQAEADSQKKDESRVPLKANQTFNQFQMLQMLMIPSGNNVARQLARWDASSEAAFVKKMNAAAKKLGMTKTTYTDPSGLDKSTVSTAVDQLKLAEEVMKNAAFRAVVTTENVKIDGLPEKLYNNNSLLTTMPGVVRGIKTGSSTPAGGAFMWSAYRTIGGKDQLLLGVTMDQHTGSTDPNAHLALALENSSKIITAGKDALVSATVVKKGQVVGYVDDGLGGQTPVVATKALKAVGWPGMKATFSMDDAGKTIPHTAKAGTEVGELTVGNGASEQKVPVALQKDLTEPSFGSKLTRIG